VHVALWAAATAVRVPGDFVECGVNAGLWGSAIMRRLEWKNIPKRFYLMTRFADQSRHSIRGGNRSRGSNWRKKAIASGGYVTDMERVRRNYAEWLNAAVIQGVVPEILPEFRSIGWRFSISI
jgi:hypothetical protein